MNLLKIQAGNSQLVNSPTIILKRCLYVFNKNQQN